MKMLRLENTAEGLKLARCIEPNVILSGEDDYHRSRFLGTALDGFIVSHLFWGDEEGEISREVKVDIPLENLKLNPFLAMEHGVSVVNICSNNKPVSLGGIFQLDRDTADCCMAYCRDIEGYEFSCDVDDLFLDLENLPNGCEVVKIKE